MPAGSHLARIARTVGADGELFARLAALQAADLRAALLDVAGRRAARLRPAGGPARDETGPPGAPARSETVPTVQPSSADPAARRRLERLAMDLLPDGFVELQLAPHAPLGT